MLFIFIFFKSQSHAACKRDDIWHLQAARAAIKEQALTKLASQSENLEEPVGAIKSASQRMSCTLTDSRQVFQSRHYLILRAVHTYTRALIARLIYFHSEGGRSAHWFCRISHTELPRSFARICEKATRGIKEPL